MSQIQTILGSELFLQLSGACFAMLIHSVWLGLLLSIISGVFLAAGRRFSPSARYTVLLVAFLLFLAGCGYAFVREWPVLSGASGDNLYAPGLQGPAAAQWLSWLRVNAPLIVSAWLIICLVNMVRLALTLALRDPRRQMPLIPAPSHWQERTRALAEKLGINRTITLLESAAIHTPVLAGYLKPVILIPAGLLTSLPPDQVEAVLLHELAHIRRNDYLVNLLQGLAEAVFFFNPGLLWISRQLREEREHCCDDLALEQLTDRLTFVHALIGFKEHALYRSRYPLAFSGSKDQLFARINRIVGNPVRTSNSGKIRTLLYRSSLSILMLAAMIYIDSPSRLKANAASLPEGGIPAIPPAPPVPPVPQSTVIAAPGIPVNDRTPDHPPTPPDPADRFQQGAAQVYTDTLPRSEPPKLPEPLNTRDSWPEKPEIPATAPDPPAPDIMPDHLEAPEKRQAAMEQYLQQQEKYLGDMKKYGQDMKVYEQALRRYSVDMEQYKEKQEVYRKEMKEYERKMQQYRDEMKRSSESPGKKLPPGN